MAAKFEIEKFNGNNFSLWKLKMKAILRKDKCLAAIGERPAELTSLSCKMIQQERAEILLQSLPDLYDQVIINLTSNVLSDYLVFTDVAATILEEENRRNNREDMYKLVQDSCNDHELNIIRIRSIMVKMHDGTVRTIRDVRHVEGLKKNLVVSHRVAVSWHQKLGHMFEQGMKILVERKLLWPHKVYLGSRFGSFDGVASTGFILGGAKYFVSSLIEYSSRVVVYQSRRSLMCLKFSKVYKARVELDSGKKIKCLRTDNGGEYTGDEFDTFCRQEGIKRQFTTASISQQNGDKLYHFNCRVELKDTDGNVAGKQGWRVRLDERKGVIACGDPLPTSSTSAEMLSYGKTKIQRKIKKRTQQRWNENRHESKAKHTRTLNRKRRRPGWQADYVMESNVAYCLLTEEGEPSTLQEALNNPDASGLEMTIIRVVLAMCATYDLHLEHVDVKTVFLHRNLEEEIYMLQQEGFKQKGKENLVCRSLEYNRLHADPCAYFKRFGNDDFIILLLYVDDMLVTSPNKDRINKLKLQLAKEFEMKDLGPANKILGMQIHQDRVSRKIWLSQKSYVKKILQRFNMEDCKPISTPFPTNVKLSSKMSPSSEKERMKMSRVPYASAVGSLMFAMICTRPDITHAMGVVSRYMAEPGREHWEAVKRILRYIKGTSDVALCFGESNLIVKGYVDSDYAGDLDGSKSTTGYVFTLSGGTVSWVSKLQSVVAMSTTEAEYVAAAQASKEAVWLKMLLEELGHAKEKITLFCDNQSALYLARNPTFHSKTKHIRVQYHFVREKVEEGTVDMQKIHTDDNVADYMTKAINCDKFIWCRSSCGLAET
ncbi:gag-pol polyprotein [Tanacetum coccineum]